MFSDLLLHVLNLDRKGRPLVSPNISYAAAIATVLTRPPLVHPSLEDLFVDESMRGRGVGKALFKYLGQRAKELDCPRMDWVVLE